MLDVAVIADPVAAEVSLDPVRARLLAALAEPASATSLAAAAGLSRQQANYHLRALERHGLVELAEVAPDPDRAPDQASARWMLALAARLVREVGELITRSSAARKRIATFAIDTEIRFASATDRAAFARELGDTVSDLVAKYHDQQAEGGREHRLVAALHPSITDPPTKE